MVGWSPDACVHPHHQFVDVLPIPTPSVASSLYIWPHELDSSHTGFLLVLQYVKHFQTLGLCTCSSLFAGVLFYLFLQVVLGCNVVSTAVHIIAAFRLLLPGKVGVH